MPRKITLLVVTLMISSLANAVCYRDGKPYPSGSEVGGYVCQPDGTWKRK